MKKSQNGNHLVAVEESVVFEQNISVVVPPPHIATISMISLGQPQSVVPFDKIIQINI